jgi:hypothetical protein
MDIKVIADALRTIVVENHRDVDSEAHEVDAHYRVPLHGA